MPGTVLGAWNTSENKKAGPGSHPRCHRAYILEAGRQAVVNDIVKFMLLYYNKHNK